MRGNCHMHEIKRTTPQHLFMAVASQQLTTLSQIQECLGLRRSTRSGGVTAIAKTALTTAKVQIALRGVGGVLFSR
jgi:hypothetical protein